MSAGNRLMARPGKPIRGSDSPALFTPHDAYCTPVGVGGNNAGGYARTAKGVNIHQSIQSPAFSGNVVDNDNLMPLETDYPDWDGYQ